MKSRYSWVFLFFILILAGNAGAVSGIPEKPAHYVVDLAGIIPDQPENKLNGYLQELEQKTSVQFIVLTVMSLENESIEAFSLSVAEKWKLGRKDKDNGVLLTVSLNDRKYRFEIGYGLEGVLPDSLVGTVGRELLVPNFRKGDYGKGILLGTVSVINTVAKEAGVEITGMPKIDYRHNNGGGRRGFFDRIFFWIFLIVVIIIFITNPSAFLSFLLLSSLGGRRGGWGGGSSGGGGGGFGSFGGGGGGSFGGGGSSGSW